MAARPRIWPMRITPCPPNPEMRISVRAFAAGAFTAWYVRNLAHTGNPMHPASVLGWPGTTFPETTLLEYARYWGWRRMAADALAVYLDWPLLHGLLATAGLVSLAGWLAWRRGALSRSARYFGVAALAITILTLATLPTMPFSAGNAMTFHSGLVHWDSMRYVALLFFLGWAA